MSVAQFVILVREAGDSHEQAKRTLWSLALKSSNPVTGMKLMHMHIQTQETSNLYIFH